MQLFNSQLICTKFYREMIFFSLVFVLSRIILFISVSYRSGSGEVCGGSFIDSQTSNNDKRLLDTDHHIGTTFSTV